MEKGNPDFIHSIYVVCKNSWNTPSNVEVVTIGVNPVAVLIGDTAARINEGNVDTGILRFISNTVVPGSEKTAFDTELPGAPIWPPVCLVIG